jgi:hypothetical protein
MRVYGSEGCCDGQNNIRFKKAGGEWRPIKELHDSVKKIVTAVEPSSEESEDEADKVNEHNAYVSIDTRQSTTTIAGTGEDFGTKLKDHHQASP